MIYIYITNLVCYTHIHWFFNPAIPSNIICNNESCLLSILVTKEQLPGLRLRMEMYEKIYHNFLCLGIFFKSFLIGHFPKALVLCPMSTKCSRTVYGQKTLALGWTVRGCPVGLAYTRRFYKIISLTPFANNKWHMWP
jgi:hypothetical protein